MKYKGRVISGSSHGRFHSFVEHFVYDGIARDDESEIEGKSRHHNKRRLATEHALRRLKERLHDEGVVGINNE